MSQYERGRDGWEESTTPAAQRDRLRRADETQQQKQDREISEYYDRVRQGLPPYSPQAYARWDATAPGRRPYRHRVATKATLGTTLQFWALLVFAIGAIWNTAGPNGETVEPWHALGVLALLVFGLTILDGFVNRGRPTPKGQFSFWRRRLRVATPRMQRTSNADDDFILGLLFGWFFFGRKR